MIFALPLTIGLVCTIGLIVSGSVLLIRTSLGRSLNEPPTLTFYIFIIAAALLFSSVFFNYSLGPYAVCDTKLSQADLQNILLNATEANQGNNRVSKNGLSKFTSRAI